MSGSTRFAEVPPKKYCLIVRSVEDTHPTIALDPTICPLLENPIAMNEFTAGVERTKGHMFEEVCENLRM